MATLATIKGKENVYRIKYEEYDGEFFVFRNDKGIDVFQDFASCLEMITEIIKTEDNYKKIISVFDRTIFE